MHRSSGVSISTSIPMHRSNSSSNSTTPVPHSNSSTTRSAQKQQPFNATTTTSNAYHQQQSSGSRRQVSRPSSRAESGSSRPPSRTNETQQQFRPIDPEETQLNDFDAFNNFTSTHDFDDDESFVAETQAEPILESPSSEPIVGPPEWDGANPDAVLARLKSLKETAYGPVGLKSFYKSYSSWSKLNADQQDKAVAWFRKLPEPVKC
jgi:hypothetical protein